MAIRKVEPYEENVPDFPEGTYFEHPDQTFVEFSFWKFFLWNFVVGVVCGVGTALALSALG